MPTPTGHGRGPLKIGKFFVPTQTQAVAAVYSDSVAETLSATDAITGSLAAQGLLTEILTAADSQTVTIVASVALTESLAAADTQTETVTDAVALTESLTATDLETATAVTGVALTETLTAVDSATGGLSLLADTAETVTAADAQTTTMGLAVSQTEALAAADTITSAVDFSAAVAESLSATDVAGGTVPATYDVSVVETLAVTDAQVTSEPVPVVAGGGGGGIPDYLRRIKRALPKRRQRRVFECQVLDELTITDHAVARVVPAVAEIPLPFLELLPDPASPPSLAPFAIGHIDQWTEDDELVALLLFSEAA